MGNTSDTNNSELSPEAIVSGWLPSAMHFASPNFNARPQGSAISLLVIHNISLPPGQFGGGYVQSFFQNQLDSDAHPYFAEIAAMQVSAHLLIERTGAVTQFVGFDDRAWHAGQSVFAGRENCNDFSIGIELEGTDDTPYTNAQYTELVRISQLLIKAYPLINADRICGHDYIAPGRKTDPGPAFDWDYYFSLLGRF